MWTIAFLARFMEAQIRADIFIYENHLMLTRQHNFNYE